MRNIFREYRQRIVANTNPQGINQYSNKLRGMTDAKLRKEHAKNDDKLSQEMSKAWEKPEHAGKGAGDLVKAEGESSQLGKASTAHSASKYELERRGLRS